MSHNKSQQTHGGEDHLDSLGVYHAISQEGFNELARPNQSILWSSIAAGIAIAFSVIVEGALRAHLPDAPHRHLIENLGYTSGFVIVILCRLQLFTENTITPVLPVLKNKDSATLVKMLRLWGVCFSGNMIGALIIAAALFYLPIIDADTKIAIQSLANHIAEISAGDSLARGIPAGFLIAALVWMLPSSKGSEFWVIVFMTYLIALGDFTHVIAGSVELFFIGFSDFSRLPDLIIGNLLPTLLGNVIGGTGLFALIAWAQVEAEMSEVEGEQ
ncbi:formate/nitrite transporter family protein [Fretibacter rubidus]|uniref:formate/nitrite transporter family protein n=1 Tax=Fretibacter rubidus TaxID=570162 RepID=UPI00352A1E4A